MTGPLISVDRVGITAAQGGSLFLGKKCFVMDRASMSKQPSDGTNSVAGKGESWTTLLRCQNAATNLQFEWPAFGQFDTSSVKTLQKNEQPWPYAYIMSAALEETRYQGTATGFAGNVVTDAGTPAWVVNQFANQTVATGTITNSGAVTSGDTTIPLSAGPTIALKAGGIIPWGSRYVRLAADAAVGAVSLSVYPVNGGINISTNATTIVYGPTLWVTATSGSSLNRYALISSNAAGTVTVGSGLTTMANGDTYEIRCIYPLSVGGALEWTVFGFNAINDPLAIITVPDTDYRMRTSQRGGPWPQATGFRSSEDVGQANADFVYGGFTQGLATGPLAYVASYGDPIGTPRKSVLNIGDSVGFGTGDQTSRAMGWLARACYGVVALCNLGCGGEAGYPGGTNANKSLFRRRMMKIADTVILNHGRNDQLDAAPINLGQMKSQFTGWYNAAIAAGCKDIVACVIGPSTSSGITGQFPGQEANQVTVQAATTGSFDDWLRDTVGGGNAPWAYVRTFDYRPTIGFPGNTVKWNTYAPTYSGTVGATSSTTVIKDAGIPAGSQSTWAGYGIRLNHSGVFYDGYVKLNTADTPGQLTLNSALTAVSTGDTFTINVVGADDGTHFAPPTAAIVAALFVTFGISRA